MAQGIKQGMAASSFERWYDLYSSPNMKGYEDAKAATHCFAAKALLPILVEPSKPKAPRTWLFVMSFSNSVALRLKCRL